MLFPGHPFHSTKCPAISTSQITFRTTAVLLPLVKMDQINNYCEKILMFHPFIFSTLQEHHFEFNENMCLDIIAKDQRKL